VIHDILGFLTRWSPHIWLVFSVFGILMSATLTTQAFHRRQILKGHPQLPQTVPRYWFRHAVSFLFLHTGYVVVGVFSVAHVRSDWADLLTLGFLLATPLVLAFRSFDSLRLSYLQRKERQD
jgi:hypothetical protein